ncbi:Cytochrome b561 and DOMON domain-containing protein [Quillaja saponaria]|uniref:Cytochrome b561 and DOMON domain-containing protein n=1 Tax=Quillaja saponaria TaxID=32244 RepID=A0AAD7L2V7_QUISA|nr:Cytochrome b561 and DOMON domain-containing protein [Quillaja saponaria]
MENIKQFQQASADVWSFVLSFPSTINSYVAIGFSSDGNMVGSSAIVGWLSGGSGGLKQYYLGGTSPGDVQPDKGNLKAFNSSIIAAQGSTFYIAFQLLTSQPESRLIYAVGPTGVFPPPQTFALMEHTDKISTRIDYAKGTSSKTSNETLRRSHGVLNMVGWGILMLVGVIIARHFKEWDPIWFYVHTAIQTLGFIIGIVGVLCGFVLSNRLKANVTAHKNIGILMLVLGFLQVLAFLIRPGKDSKVRKYWNWYHYTVGRILIIFAVANTFYGIHLGGEGSKWFLGYGIVLIVLVLVAVGLEIRIWKKRNSSIDNPSYIYDP